MDFLEIARTRQSCRSYDETKNVEREKLDAILEAVRLKSALKKKNIQSFTKTEIDRTRNRIKEGVIGVGERILPTDALTSSPPISRIRMATPRAERYSKRPCP